MISRAPISKFLLTQARVLFSPSHRCVLRLSLTLQFWTVQLVRSLSGGLLKNVLNFIAVLYEVYFKVIT